MPEYNFTFDWNRITTIGKVKILAEQVVGSPSQAQISQAVADYIDSHPGALSPLSQATKSALLDIAEHVAYIDANGQSRYAALDAALNAKALLSITAVYTQSGTVYDTDNLDSLKDDLVVTAYYDDGTTADVTSACTLSGTLAEGTSTVTVTYQEKTATFEVTVTHAVLPQGFTKYDYMSFTGVDTTKYNRGILMPTKTYANLNNISVEFEYVSKVGTTSGDCILGGRSASGSASSLAFYTATSKFGYHIHGSDSAINIPQTQNEKHKVILTNSSATPSTLSFDGTDYSISWSNSNTINTFMSLFCNQQAGNTSIYQKPNIEVGEIIVRDLSGNVINDYFPCVRTSDNVIGLYDIIEDAFYTCSTVTYATIGNAGNKYAVGNWS